MIPIAHVSDAATTVAGDGCAAPPTRPHPTPSHDEDQ